MAFVSKVFSYLNAKFSEETLPEVQLQRMAECFRCDWLLEERRNAKGQLDVNGNPVTNPYYYCKKCGCPKTRYWPDSELRKKVTMGKAECPLNKWVE